MGKFIDLTGQRFGRLTVVERAKNTKSKKVRWICQCKCGNVVVVLGDSLRTGKSKSCGCLQKEIAAMIKTKYPDKDERLYSIWCDMKARCYVTTNPSYPHYGGRGIHICVAWKNDFSAFESWAVGHGYAADLTIDRIDNDGPYAPYNCRWVGILEQANNKRNNIRLTYNGETKTIAQWARDIGVSYDTIHNRVELGWSIERVLTYKNYD